MAKNECNELAAAGAGAIVSAAVMLLLGIGWNLGVYNNAAEQMAKWHLFFWSSIGGILAGMVEAAFWGFVLVYAFVWVYKKLL